MTRCLTCDRPLATGPESWPDRTLCHAYLFPCLDHAAWPAAWSDCQAHQVDWRARALAAEKITKESP